MAQKVMLTCDVDGDDTAAEETVRFGLDGREYEIDLCPRHHKELNNTIKTYVDRGRKIEGGSAPRKRRARSGVATSGSATGASTRPPASASPRSSALSSPRPALGRKEDLQQIRSWGRDNGMTVSDRGRISAELSEAYAAAHR